MADSFQLSSADIEAIAVRVVALLNAQPSAAGRYVDAARIAKEFNVDRDWVYAHSSELGGFRLGGPKGRLRFDLLKIRQSVDLEARLPIPPPGGEEKQQLGKAPRKRVGSPRKQRRASGGAPARSPSNTKREVARMMKPDGTIARPRRGAS